MKGSSYLSDRDAVRTMLRRAAVRAVDDAGSQQRLDLSGLSGDQPADVPTVALFGFSANPPAGGVGLILCPGGGSDKALFFGGESAKYRPKNQPPGGVTLYDAFGQAISFVQNDVKVVGTQTVTIQAPTINLVGQVNLGSASAAVAVELSNSTAATKVKAI